MKCRAEQVIIPGAFLEELLDQLARGVLPTPPRTSNRWLRPGVSSARTVETSAPVFGSAAP
jgi:hypothetical protein